MEEFEYKTLQDKKKMALEELKLYCYNLRAYENKSNINSMQIKRRVIFLIRLITKINRLLNHRSLRILRNQSYQTSLPKLYISTKSENAIESLSELMKSPYHITSEDKGNLSDIERMLLESGILRILNNDAENDKDLIRAEQERNLANNGIEVVFPEISSSSSMIGELSDEPSRLVIETGATIIPVVTEDYYQDNKTVSIVNIGKNLHIGSTNPEYLKEITKIISIDLRNLKEEINSKYGNPPENTIVQTKQLSMQKEAKFGYIYQK